MHIKLTANPTPEAMLSIDRLQAMYEAYARKKHTITEVLVSNASMPMFDDDDPSRREYTRYIQFVGAPDDFLNQESGYHRLVDINEQGQRYTVFILVNRESEEPVRSYVFNPYTSAKDLRSGVETDDVEAVMRGELDIFYE